MRGSWWLYSFIRQFEILRPILLGNAQNDRNEIIRNLAALDNIRRGKTVLSALEDRCTPLDFADALARVDLLPGALSSFLRHSAIAELLKESPPETYRSVDIVPDITVYSDPAFPPDAKTLLIVFTGRLDRPFIPGVTLLQALPARRFDIVMLRDPAALCFEGGIANYAATLPDLSARLARDLDIARYADRATAGMSAGSLAALRAGILMGTERAIAFGPRFTWHIGRLVTGGLTVPAFDLLCDCGPRNRTRLFAVYAAGHVEDAAGAEQLARTLPINRLPIAGTDKHNVVHFLAKAGRLRDFVLQILES